MTRELNADGSNTLPPVMGGGRSHEPRLACIFINPTIRNASTSDGWMGPRLPFIGTRAVWRVFSAAGLLPTGLAADIEKQGAWEEQFAAHVYATVANSGLYITNLVKWTGRNGDLPSTALIKRYVGILRRELELVRPDAIVTFGGLPFQALTGNQIRLASIFDTLCQKNEPFSVTAPDISAPIYPCYFPVGRGNPRRAIQILRAVAAALHLPAADYRSYAAQMQLLD